MADSKRSVFQKVSPVIDFPKSEERILGFWKERGVFEKTLEARKGGPSFVFYEGPPTANGMPHNGHVLTRVIKDLFPRYKTMRGYEVPRKAGWDTHGLPVEVEVEKELRIHGKADIMAYGVEPFVTRCIESVFRYTSEWEKLTERIGFWVDLDEAYVTYHRSYVQSVWWALKNLYEKGLLYQGHKVVWWWAKGGTALSSAEVGLGYKTVDDPSAYVAFPLADDPSVSLLVWTTTPWTLPSNMYAAVKADVGYALVDDGGRKLIVAEALVESLEKKLGRELTVLGTHKGEELVGQKYIPPFDLYANEAAKNPDLAGKAFTIIAADFVTLDSGTGIVHIAPAFGEDDFEAHRKLHGDKLVAPFCAVQPDGTFVPELSQYAGMWVKDGDKPILKELQDRGILVHHELYRHDYPFCWRADDDPLIQYARPAWFIRTTAEIQKAIANNRAVNWLPEHIKEGRFGDFLQNNVDWALSRERFWGTPLPIWRNAKTGEMVAIGSLDELRQKPGCNLAEVEGELSAYKPELATHLIVHKPWIDKVRWGSEEEGYFERVPDVIDCWFDSGCMPFAQWGFPHAEGSKEKFDKAFPADFISEAIDQTRGWFYSLLMISTLVFDDETLKSLGLSPRPFPHPYKTCIVLGHVGDREGKKESKSKGNYTPPEVILEKVAMDFAVIDAAELGLQVPPKGTALIAREDLEGLDLQEGAKVAVYRPDQADDRHSMILKVGKKLPRRVVLLCKEDMDTLGARMSSQKVDVKVVEVPRLADSERVTIEDPTTPAPGADGFRWFFYASSPPWSNVRHSLSNVRALQKDFQVKLRNVYSFFTIYADIDGWSPADGNTSEAKTVFERIRQSPHYRPARERHLLDQWMLSELALATREVGEHLDAYRVFEAAQRLLDLTDALSNWYVRRSRDRFWAPRDSEHERDKQDAYLTLYETLVTMAALAAPFVPFFAEEMYQNLVRGPFPSLPESVHLIEFPHWDREAIQEDLSEEMRSVRELVSLGLQVRMNGRLKVRQPLARADVVLAKQELSGRLTKYAPLIQEELNVKELRFLKPGEEGQTVRYRLKPNFRALGPKLGKNVQLAKKVLAESDPADLRVELANQGFITLNLAGQEARLGPDEIEVAVEAAEGFAAAGDRVGVVVLHTELTEELLDEGLSREVLARVQAVRKDLDLGYTERIRLAIAGSERIAKVCERHREVLMRESLASELTIGKPGFEPIEEREVSFDGETVRLAIARTS